MREELEKALGLARELPPEELPRLLGELEEIRATALARLTAPVVQPQSADALLSIDEAAEKLGMSRAYLYRHQRAFAFTRRVGRSLRFSAQGIEQYIRRTSTLTPRRHGVNISPAR